MEPRNNPKIIETQGGKVVTTGNKFSSSSRVILTATGEGASVNVTGSTIEDGATTIAIAGSCSQIDASHSVQAPGSLSFSLANADPESSEKMWKLVKRRLKELDKRREEALQKRSQERQANAEKESKEDKPNKESSTCKK